MHFIAQIAHLVETHRQVKLLGDRTISEFKHAKNPPKGEIPAKIGVQKENDNNVERLEIEQNYTLGTNRKPTWGYRSIDW